VWGLFVALGFLFGALMAGRLARQRGENPAVVWDLVPWLMVAGLVGGRLGHVLLYDPQYFWVHPTEIPAVWQGGASVFGGLLAASAVAVWRLRAAQVDVWRYADVLAFGLPFGKWLGRLGCFLIHDHPGTATDFVLGVQYPDGTVRHDLGLYLSLNALALSCVFLWLSRKERPVGTYLGVFAVWYGVTRFLLDFLRVADTRYGALTPAQYFCLLLVAYGVGVLVWITKQTKQASCQ
jgi:phosphatidylglycerol:prolipoprotein diacylglycerol transferase